MEFKVGDILYIDGTNDNIPGILVRILQDPITVKYGLDYGGFIPPTHTLGRVLQEHTGWWASEERLYLYMQDNSINRLLYPERTPYKGYLCRKSDLVIIKKLLD